MIDINILTQFYQSDSELIETFHICSGQGLDKCIERTYNDLLQSEVQYLMDDDKIIGYYALNRSSLANFLVGFFIMPEYRKDKSNWEQIIDNLPNNTYCGLFNCNKRAIRFFEKQNYEFVCMDKEKNSNIFKVK